MLCEDVHKISENSILNSFDSTSGMWSTFEVLASKFLLLIGKSKKKIERTQKAQNDVGSNTTSFHKTSRKARYFENIFVT